MIANSILKSSGNLLSPVVIVSKLESSASDVNNCCHTHLGDYLEEAPLANISFGVHMIFMMQDIPF